jgi:predicted GIY-YIG superfamily endonuclease
MKENKDYKIHYDKLEELKVNGVYLIRNLDNKKLKIGITNDMSRRLHEIEKSFQFCGTIPKLNIECFIEYEHNLELEQYLHKEFKKFNHQNEWFSIDSVQIVLDKIIFFEYKEKQPLKKNVIKKKGNSLLTDNYRYYKYNLKNRLVDCIVFLKRKRKASGMFEEIDRVAKSVGYMWNWHFICEEDLEELKSKEIKALDKLFLYYKTDTIAKVEDNYMRLDTYLGNVLRDKKINILTMNRENIIKILDELINCNYNTTDIETIKSDIIKIEEQCYRMQEYINESIETHRMKNYKQF